MEKLFTPAEAAEFLNVSTKTIYRYVKAGYLKSTRIGVAKKTLRIPQSELERVLQVEKSIEDVEFPSDEERLKDAGERERRDFLTELNRVLKDASIDEISKVLNYAREIVKEEEEK